ncbi:MAG: gliding motility-associated-like protein [Parvicella sp.]|jgi:gliding motility-associated-like protein
MLKNVGALAIFILITSSFYAQTIVSISDGAVATCNGTLFDTGGQGGTGYGNNESFTLTICPDNPIDIITLDFLNFNLSNVNTAAPNNNSDNLTIYDGDNVAATSLGTYGTNQLQGLLVSCTSLNTTGCITLVFTSNDMGTGTFAATITCATPCQRPTVSMAAPIVFANPHRICDGDNVNFDGSSSIAAAGFNIVQYCWNWGDGTTDTTLTPTTNHTFNTGAAEYPVNLFVIDDNGCINSNLETINVQVGTDPNMNFISSDTLLCIGETVCLEAFPQLMPITWTGLPVSGLGGATYLPDNVGSCFTADLDFGAFTPGQTLNNINDLQDICVSMEHSFMGDLVATIYCPSGQSVILHQQNGGGTYLGDPDPADDPNLPGNCASYCWSPTATNGTWVDNSAGSATPNLVASPLAGGTNALAPGTYESLNSLGGLVGCDLNGTWTLEFCDLWAFDDGFVCDWSMQFDPSIYPPLTVFTPVIGDNSDSSYWNGPGVAGSFITSTTPEGNEICVTPTQTGSFGYEYHVIDNHGCEYDTTIFVTVGNGPTIDAGPDVTICPGDIQMDATALGGIDPSPTCDYTINMFDTFGDGWNGFSIEVILDGVSQGNYTMPTGSNGQGLFPVSDGQTISFNTTSGIFDSEVSYQVLDCDGVIVFQNGVNYGGGNPQIGTNVWNTIGVSNVPPLYQYSWTPVAGVNAATDEDPLITTLATATYDVEVWESNHPSCSSTDQIIITVVNNGYAGEDTTLNYCLVDPIVDLFTLIPNNPDVGGVWEDLLGNSVSNMFDPATQLSTSLIYVVGTGACSDTAMVNVNVAVPFILTVNNDTIICQNGTGVVLANYSGGLGGPYIETWSQGVVGNGPHLVNPLISTCYDVFITDAFGCASPIEQVCVNLNPPIIINVVNDDSICSGLAGNIEVTAFGGNNNYVYNWTDNGVTVATTAQVSVSPIVTTEYCIEVSDGCETTPIIECIEVAIYPMPVLAFSSDITNGCYPIDVNFTNTTNSPLVMNTDWDFGNGSTGNGLGPVLSTYNLPICYDVEMEVTTINGCITVLTNPGMICPDDYPVADYIMGPNPTNINQTVISFTENGSTDVTSFEWDFGPESLLSNSFDANPIVTFPSVEPGTYDVNLNVINAAGCEHDTTYTLVINGVYSMFIPNSFTPNGDGFNDVFTPLGDAVTEEGYELIIFDRDGHIIFETTEFGTGWDGTAKTGEMLPFGVYVWKLRAKDLYENVEHDLIGHVTLIR